MVYFIFIKCEYQLFVCFLFLFSFVFIFLRSLAQTDGSTALYKVAYYEIDNIAAIAWTQQKHRGKNF